MTQPIWMLALAAIAVLGGCSHYLPPGAKADLQVFAPAEIAAGFATQATAPFPASIAAVRVQAPAYTNHYLDANGGRVGIGRYSVIAVREVEMEHHFEQIAKLPQVAGVTGINRMLLPDRLDGERDLRTAASRLQADLVFVYTFDTAFFDTDAARPLTVITLGLAPTRRIAASTTASALLLDTRTGYIYATYEVTVRRDTVASSWGSRDTADRSRRDNEREAFGRLIDDVAASWPKLLERHLKKSP
jgi:hypothetical protein